MIRDLRRADATKVFELMQTEFPEESALLGGRREELERVVRRVLRWDTRFLLGLLRLFGRPIFRMIVVEADGQLAGTTMVTFESVSAYISDVVVDPRFRRRGFAKRMLDEARATARRTRRRYLVLDVLDSNARARPLYDSLGYRPLRARTQLVLDPVTKLGAPPPAHPAIRPFEKRDAPALTAIARRQAPTAVEEVLPSSRSAFIGSAMANRMMQLQQGAWVVDRGHGAEAYASSSYSPVFLAGHMSAPVVAETVEPALADALVRTAGAWCAALNPPRILTVVPEENARGRAALEAAGFQPAFKLWTMYRTVD